MKRMVSCIAVLVLCLCLSACGAQSATPTNGTQQPTTPTVPQTPPTPLSLGNAVTVDGVATLALYRVETTQKISASLGDTLYYENNEDGMTYVDVVLDVAELGDSKKPDTFAKLTGGSDSGKVYAASLYAYESKDGRDMVRNGYMMKNGAYRYHAALVVPDTTKTLDLTLAVGDERFSFAYTVGERVCEVTPLNIGDTVTAQDGTQLTLRGLTYADRVDPSQAGTYYTYYSVDDENTTYLAAVFEVVHTSEEGKAPNALFGATAAYDDGACYTGFFAAEDQNGQGFSTDGMIASGESRLVYCLIEVPKTATQQALTLRIAFDQKEYEVVM